jgi:hypothetical protein
MGCRRCRHTCSAPPKSVMSSIEAHSRLIVNFIQIAYDHPAAHHHSPRILRFWVTVPSAGDRPRRVAGLPPGLPCGRAGARSMRCPTAPACKICECRTARALRVPFMASTSGPSRLTMDNQNSCSRALSHPGHVVLKLSIKHRCLRLASLWDGSRTGSE